MDVLGYARVSTKKQTTSLRNQEETIKDYCNKNGFNLVKIYSEVISAKKLIIQRPQGRLLYEHAKKDGLCVVVTFCDRLSRDPRDTRYFGCKDVIWIYEDPNQGMVETLSRQITSILASYYGLNYKKAIAMIVKDHDLSDDFYDIVVENNLNVSKEILIPFLKERLPLHVVKEYESIIHISFESEAA